MALPLSLLESNLKFRMLVDTVKRSHRGYRGTFRLISYKCLTKKKFAELLNSGWRLVEVHPRDYELKRKFNNYTFIKEKQKNDKII